MKIALLVEGATEVVFLPYLRGFLEPRLPGKMPRFEVRRYDHCLPTQEDLRFDVETLLTRRDHPADHVIALTDIYTDVDPRNQPFSDGKDARTKMRAWIGENERFHPHVAQYEFEAWLLPFWEIILDMAGSKANKPSEQPERVNHNNPPSKRIKEVFRLGAKDRKYIKTREARQILEKARNKHGADALLVAAQQCPELKAFLNTILKLCGGEQIA